MKTMFPPGLAILASVNLLFATFFGSHANAQTTEATMEVTSTSEPGNCPIQQGLAAGVTLQPAQAVSVALQFPTSYAGQPVLVGPLDGGEVTAEENLSVSSEGKVEWNFQAGSARGLYRVSLQVGLEQHLLQFHVISP
jgi:hypothetical protein